MVEILVRRVFNSDNRGAATVLSRLLGSLMVLATFAGPVHADNLVLTGDADWAPLSAPEEPEQGLISAITARAFDAVGIEIEIDLLPWGRALRAGEAAEYDGVIGAFFTEERARVFAYSDPVFEQRIVLLAKTDLPLDSYESFEDLQAFRIGVIRDNALAGGIEKSNLNFDYAYTVESNVRKLVTDRVDVIAGELWRLRHQLRLIGAAPSDFKILSPQLGSQVAYIVVSKKHPRTDWILSNFNRGLARIRTERVYDALLNDFGFAPAATAAPR